MRNRAWGDPDKIGVGDRRRDGKLHSGKETAKEDGVALRRLEDRLPGPDRHSIHACLPLVEDDFLQDPRLG